VYTAKVCTCGMRVFLAVKSRVVCVETADDEYSVPTLHVGDGTPVTNSHVHAHVHMHTCVICSVICDCDECTHRVRDHRVLCVLIQPHMSVQRHELLLPMKGPS
jgi:recombinational DNA repair protein RecR